MLPDKAYIEFQRILRSEDEDISLAETKKKADKFLKLFSLLSQKKHKYVNKDETKRIQSKP